MERIGERLRRRREELGLTLEDVSEAIRYRPEIVRAMEEGRTNVFPAKAYLSAFLRAYAAILEIDPAEILRDQKSEEERAFEAIRNIRIRPKRRRRFPRRVLYILVPVVLAAVLLIVIDRLVWDREQAAGTAPPDGLAAETAGLQSFFSDSTRQGDALEDSTVRATGGVEQPGDAGDEGGPGGAGQEGRSAAPAERSAEGGESEVPDVTSGDGAGRPTAAPAVRDGGAGDEDTRVGTAPGERTRAPAAATVEEARAVSREDVRRVEGADVAPASRERGEPAVSLSEAETSGRPGRHKLVVSARRGAYINLVSGAREIYNGYFGGGEVDSFFSEDRFVIIALTDRGAWTLVLDGERVLLPGSSSEDVSNFVIPLPSGD